MATKQVTAHIPEEDYLELVEEFQTNGCKSLTDYVQQLIAQRKEKTVTLQSGDVERVKSMFEGKVEILKEQLAKAQSDLATVSSTTALAGVDDKKENVNLLIKKALEDERNRRKQEDLVREHAELTAKCADLTTKNETMQAQITSDARIAKAMEVGGTLLEGFARINPQGAQKLTNGIAGLFGGGESISIGDATLTGEQEMAFKAGQTLLNEFQDDQHRLAMVEIVQYFAANEQALVKFVQKNQHFQNWSKSQQAEPVQ